jgi:hypothetical protein
MLILVEEGKERDPVERFLLAGDVFNMARFQKINATRDLICHLVETDQWDLLCIRTQAIRRLSK